MKIEYNDREHIYTTENGPKMDPSARQKALKHVASALIIDILMEEASPVNRISQLHIVKCLRDRYGLSLTRQAVSRHLSRLMAEDLRVAGDAKKGYFLQQQLYGRAN